LFPSIHYQSTGAPSTNRQIFQHRAHLFSSLLFTERSHHRHHGDSERHRSSRQDHRDRDRGDRNRDRDRDRGRRDRDDRERYSHRDRERPDRGDRDRDPDWDRERGRYREEGRPRYEEERRREYPREDDRRRPFGGQDEGSPSRGARRGRGRERNGGSQDRRSPTPVGTVTLSQRKRKASGWDVHAPGYEQYSAMQAKQTGADRPEMRLSAVVNISNLGLFNLPGANRTQIPPILAVPGLPPPMPVPTFGMGMAVNPNLSRQSRRLYIGSITPEINEQNLADFFNNKMTEMKIGTGAPGNPVLAVQCNYEKSYAFVEVRSL
jgi:splicing factor U2AF 65 kDa subunit